MSRLWCWILGHVWTCPDPGLDAAMCARCEKWETRTRKVYRRKGAV